MLFSLLSRSLSCYDEGKRIAETLCMDYHRQHGVDVRLARLFNTYGPRMLENDGRVVSNFIVQALTGRPLTVYGDGSQTRSFCYVDDTLQGEEEKSEEEYEEENEELRKVDGDAVGLGRREERDLQLCDIECRGRRSKGRVQVCAHVGGCCFFSESGLLRLMNQDAHIGPINIGNPHESTIQQLADTIQRLVNPNAHVTYQPVPSDDPRRRQPDITRARTVLHWEPHVSLDDGLSATVADFRARLAVAREAQAETQAHMASLSVDLQVAAEADAAVSE